MHHDRGEDDERYSDVRNTPRTSDTCGQSYKSATTAAEKHPVVAAPLYIARQSALSSGSDCTEGDVPSPDRSNDLGLLRITAESFAWFYNSVGHEARLSVF